MGKSAKSKTGARAIRLMQEIGGCNKCRILVMQFAVVSEERPCLDR